MMTSLQFLVRGGLSEHPEEPQALALRADDTVFTRLLRPNVTEPDDYLLAPPALLAFWLADNWWRLRWESIPPNGMIAEWRLAHELASIGGGYIWPRLAIWSESERIGLLSRADPQGIVGPIRYLTNALSFVPASRFEVEGDRFIDNVIGAYATSNSDRAALVAQVEALRTERADSDISDWRRMEARLGFDPDDAPDDAIEALEALVAQYGSGGVEEAAMAAPGRDAAATLDQEIAAAVASHVECDFTEAIQACVGLKLDFAEAPWVTAERAASTLRNAFGAGNKPIKNRALAEILHVPDGVFQKKTSSTSQNLPYGLRLLEGGAKRRDLIAVRSRWSHDRRFEISRALGDAVFARGERLGPLAASKTARQKFQRAFAQSLLCPYEGLIAYVGTEQPTDGDLFAAAQYFHVSERLVRTVLVNKRVIERSRLNHTNFRDIEPERIEELVEAA